MLAGTQNQDSIHPLLLHGDDA